MHTLRFREDVPPVRLQRFAVIADECIENVSLGGVGAERQRLHRAEAFISCDERDELPIEVELEERLRRVRVIKRHRPCLGTDDSLPDAQQEAQDKGNIFHCRAP